MPYIQRDGNNRIVGVFAASQHDGQEFQEEAELWTDPSSLIQYRINDLERHQLMPRATREFMLMFMEQNAPPEVLAVNPGYQAVKAFDEQIKKLRAQL